MRSQAEMIATFYRKNQNAILSRGSETKHSMTVDLADYDVPKTSLKLPHDDFPYMRIALIDKHLEETNA